jgi:hypothetical protein
MSEIQIIRTEQEVLNAQLEFETSLWVYHRDMDERAAHMNKDALNHRKQAMERIDGLLERLFIVQLDVGKGSE